MRRITPTGSKTTSVTTNGHAGRRCASWIESFVEGTASLDTPKIFRLWTAISVLGAVVEQKVYMRTGKGLLYPNMYTMLVAHPGVGKTATIRRGKQYYMEVPKPHPAPTSLTGASMIDAMKKNVREKNGDLPEYNSMYLIADEFGAFMHKYDQETVSVMSAFYDTDGFSQWRRGNELKLAIKSPQMNALCGSTPSNLLNTMPDFAWDQGFASRFVMIFSDERILGDDFADGETDLNPDLVHDLCCVATIRGRFYITGDYVDKIKAWREAGEAPAPSHPKLLHYTTRRRVHLYKLSMVSSLDRGDGLAITAEDFDRGLEWLTAAEVHMADVFLAGSGSDASKALEDIHHFVIINDIGGKGVPSHRILNFAKSRVPLTALDKLIKNMEQSGMLKQAGLDPKNKNVIMYRAGFPTLDAPMPEKG